MISLNATQLAIVAAEDKDPTWLFEVYDALGSPTTTILVDKSLHLRRPGLHLRRHAGFVQRDHDQPGAVGDEHHHPERIDLLT